MEAGRRLHSPLMYAADQGNYEAVKALIDAGVESTLKTFVAPRLWCR
jgi:hypothetical protein